jgi:hypothetical protein
VAAVGLGCNAPEKAEEYYHDFRGKPIPSELTLFNVQDEKLLQVEPEGVHIRIPKDWTHPWGGVGFRTAFGFEGDFEVTTTFELLQAEAEPSTFGAGVYLYVAKPGGGAGIGRLVLGDGRPIVLCEKANAKGQGQWLNVSPCDDKVGRLRLKRTGSALSFWWAPGVSGDNFQEKHRTEFGTDSIERIRLVALNGRVHAAVGARFLELRVRGTGVPVTDAPRSRWPIVAAAGIILALSVLLLGTWFFVRQRRRNLETATPVEKH